MKKLVLGILAHVDAGKTTLSESLLYISGKIREMGRVDRKNAYLDTHALEKERGITIFSKQALLQMGELEVALLDTPGHVDFSAEMERTLQVLDYALLVVSGSAGVQGHTKTLWRLLAFYKIPVFIFINKMDLQIRDQGSLLAELKEQLGGGCLHFGSPKNEDFYEEVALRDEGLTEAYLETGEISAERLRAAIMQRKIFPCYFGSALKLTGVAQLMAGLSQYLQSPTYPREFGAKIFKVSRDEQGQRLTHLKIVGGTLQVKDTLQGAGWAEKVNQIRLYSGDKFVTCGEVTAGAICAVTGLSRALPGENIGVGADFQAPVLEPLLSYTLVLPKDKNPLQLLPQLRQLEEEEPELRLLWDEEFQEIQAQIMGEVQLEVLQSIIKRRFGVAVEFGEGRVLYKETIAASVEGVGHYEPQGHYAEVQLLLSPGKTGSGLQFASQCSTESLALNWQESILGYLREKTHRGVLTGSPITDLKITLVAVAHNQLTQAGDWREASYRAVRQGLKKARSLLLAPYYNFQLEVPPEAVGKAMADINNMEGTAEIAASQAGLIILKGKAPAAKMRNYQAEVTAYSKGQGRLYCFFAGYLPCPHAQEVIAARGYDSEADQKNPTGSIFYARGASFFVSWDQVDEYMHLASSLPKKRPPRPLERAQVGPFEYDFLARAGSANRGQKRRWKRKTASREAPQMGFLAEEKENFLLVDGYNIIHAWPHLQVFVAENIDLARIKLLDALASYAGIKKSRIIVVFDAYGVQGHRQEMLDYHNIHVVFTKEAQTADQYIEKFAYEHGGEYNIKVATSDGLQQMIIRSAGCGLLSARDLLNEVENTLSSTKRAYYRRQRTEKASLQEVSPPGLQGKIKSGGLGLKKKGQK